MAGKRGPSNGFGVLLGDDEKPLANISVATMKYVAGSSARPGPIRKS